MYQIYASRSDRALYYAWEYGYSRAITMLRNEQRTIAMVRTIGGTAKRQYGYFARKRDAEYYLRRFLQIVACQRGRISGHVVCSTAEIVKV